MSSEVEWAFQVLPVVKNPPANSRGIRDTDSILGSGRSLAEGVATHSSILAWRILWTEEPGVLQSKESNMTEATEHAHTVRLKMHIHCHLAIPALGNTFIE